MIKIIIADDLSECLECDYIGIEYAEHPKNKQCCCPNCLSMDYYTYKEEEDTK